MGLVDTVDWEAHCDCGATIETYLQYKEDAVSWVQAKPHICEGSGIFFPHCTACGAREQEPCRMKKGERRFAHLGRLREAFKELQEIIDLEEKR